MKASLSIFFCIAATLAVADEAPLTGDELIVLCQGLERKRAEAAPGATVEYTQDTFKVTESDGTVTIQTGESLIAKIEDYDAKSYQACLETLSPFLRPSNQSTTHLPSYGEPTEFEMREALLAQLQNLRDSDNSIAFQNPLNGIRATVRSFDKLGCTASQGSVGYSCTYSIQIGVNVFSNERSQAGQDHAAAVNQLFQLFENLQGGPRPSIEQRRFIKSQDRWYVATSQ